MAEPALELDLKVALDGIERPQEKSCVVRLIQGQDKECCVFCRGQLLAVYDRSDLYTRNFIIVQLFLCHEVPQKILSGVFGLTVPHISVLVSNYRKAGSTGIEDNTAERIKNSLKIKGRIADYLVELLEKEERPSYQEAAKLVKKKYRVSLSAGRIGCWWRAFKKNKLAHCSEEPTQQMLPITPSEALEQPTEQLIEQPIKQEKEAAYEVVVDTSMAREDANSDDEEDDGEWRINVVAGCFILYGMLSKSQFLKPFVEGIRGALYKGKQSVERVILSLFFMHALRLKSIEQTKHLSENHFEPLVLGCFCRQQSLRYAIDAITVHENFENSVSEHYKRLCQLTDLGDEIYYTDGHFSCYYGKYAIPKGYDARRKQPSRGRNTIYLHNSLGHNVLSFESPTNTRLSVDIETLIAKMEESFGDVKGKTLFFDRGGFSAECFKEIKKREMYFTTYLKHRKKGSEVDLSLFEEVEVEINGEKISNRIYEKERETRHYGTLRVILFIGRKSKQIPVITTNLDLSSAEIVARLHKRWVEENGFKYMGEHYNIDLLTTYKTEPAPDKIMVRANPKRREINSRIKGKKSELRELKEQYSDRLNEVLDKDTVTVSDFQKQEEKLNFAIKNFEMEIGLLELEKEDIPSKVETNLKDECVITKQKRRLFINLIKAMNYNCEKWLQELFSRYHPKQDETLSLIRGVLTTPGRIRQRGNVLEVELERLDSEVQAASLDKVLETLREYNYLRLPDGCRLDIWQAI